MTVYGLAFVYVLSIATVNFNDCVTVEAQRQIYVTFLSVEVLRNKITKYCHEVARYSVYI
jgi:hypothetical protein